MGDSVAVTQCHSMEEREKLSTTHTSGRGIDPCSAKGWNSTVEWVFPSNGVVEPDTIGLLRLFRTLFVASCGFTSALFLLEELLLVAKYKVVDAFMVVLYPVSS